MTYRIAWGAATELAPDIIDGHKSFYGKATIRQGDVLTPECECVTVRELYSYGTKVAAIYYRIDGNPIVIVGRCHLFSATTGRHFRAFTRRNLNGIAYGIKAIRNAWGAPDGAIIGNIANSFTWNKSFADFYGYRF